MSGRIFSDISAAKGAIAVDISSTDAALPSGCRGIYVGATGDIIVDMPGNTGITFKNVPVGILPIQATKVIRTGTTATLLLALY